MKWLTDPKDNTPSVSLTLLLVAFMATLVCVLFGGSSFLLGSMTIVIPSADTTFLATIAGLYFTRRNITFGFKSSNIERPEI